MALDNYESILKVFANTTDTVVTPQSVVDGGKDKNKWMREGDGTSLNIHEGAGFDFRYHVLKTFFLVFREDIQTTYTTTTGGYYGTSTTTHNGPKIPKYHYVTYYLGYHGNETWFDDKNGEWNRFVNGPVEFLGPIANYGDTDTTSAKSLEAASVAVAGVSLLMQEWSGHFTRWTKELNVKGSELQGTAAGVLKQHIDYFAKQMAIVHDALDASKAATNLQKNANTLATTARTLANDIAMWAISNHPIYAMNKVFREIVDKIPTLRRWARPSGTRWWPAATRRPWSTTPPAGIRTRPPRSSGASSSRRPRTSGWPRSRP